MVDEVLLSFVGKIQQVPPVFSACKVDGKRAYELARKGEEVELKAKTLVIDEIELLLCELPVIKIRVVCSKGTYIRALARDIGVALNSGAHLIGLERFTDQERNVFIQNRFITRYRNIFSSDVRQPEQVI